MNQPERVLGSVSFYSKWFCSKYTLEQE